MLNKEYMTWICLDCSEGDNIEVFLYDLPTNKKVCDSCNKLRDVYFVCDKVDLGNEDKTKMEKK